MFTNQRYNYGFHRNLASLLSSTAIYLPDAHFNFLTKTRSYCKVEYILRMANVSILSRPELG